MNLRFPQNHDHLRIRHHLLHLRWDPGAQRTNGQRKQRHRRVLKKKQTREYKRFDEQQAGSCGSKEKKKIKLRDNENTITYLIELCLCCSSPP